MRDIGQWVEDREMGVKTIVGGDSNTRKRREAGEVQEIEEEDWDEVINREGKILVEFVERGWNLFNGNMKDDEKGEYSFTRGKGNMVIDYILWGTGK